MSKPDKLLLKRQTPLQSALVFREQKHPNLIRQQEDWFDWNGAAYSTIEDATIQAEISEFLEAAETLVVDGSKQKRVPFNPKPGDIDQTYKMLAHVCHRPANTMAPPCWLDSREAPAPRNVVACSNGLLDIDTGDLIEPTPAFFTTVALPLEYDALPPTPERWLAYLGEITGNRRNLIDLLQEMLGYLLASDTRQQRVFMLLGPPRSGKGTFLKIINALIGSHNISAPTVESIGTQFGFEPLIGKSVAMVTDMSCDDRARLSTAANRINAVSGEDPVQANRKYKKPWEGRLPVRFALAGNNLPNFGQHSAAIGTRLLMIPFAVSFLGREDRDLERKLLAELPGIFCWALDGLRRLKRRGHFVEPPECAAIKRRMLYLSDVVRGFVDECIAPDADAATPKDEAYTVFKVYAEHMGVKPIAMHEFAERLYALLPSVTETRPRVGGRQVPHFGGFRIKPRNAVVAPGYATDETAMAFVQVDQELIDLGVPVSEAIIRDVAGRPILKE